MMKEKLQRSEWRRASHKIIEQNKEEEEEEKVWTEELVGGGYQMGDNSVRRELEDVAGKSSRRETKGKKTI